MPRYFSMVKDTLAEGLRRRPAKPVGSARVGSNPTGVETTFFFRFSSKWTQFSQHKNSKQNGACED